MGVVPERQGRVAGELLLRVPMRRLVDQGRDPDRDPLLARLGLAARRRPRPRAGRSRLAGHDEGVPVDVAGAGVDRVGEDVMDDAVRPEPLAAPGPPRAGGEPLEDLADGHPLVDQPAVEHPDHLGLGLVDLQVGRHAVAGRDVAIAVGGPARRSSGRPWPSGACRGGTARRARPARTRRRPPGSGAGAGRAGRRRSAGGRTRRRSRPCGTPPGGRPGRRSGGPGGRGCRRRRHRTRPRVRRRGAGRGPGGRAAIRSSPRR